MPNLPRLAIFACFLTLLMLKNAAPEGRKSSDRKGKLFSFFQIVRFTNGPCDGDGKNGTCYTEQECESRGGEGKGSCAEGYGVCCVFEIHCGATTSENGTYFESDNVQAGACSVSICPSSDDICQLRLDFQNFVITGPVTTGPATIADAKLKATGGVLTPTAPDGKEVTLQTQCLTDTFQVVSEGGASNSDVLCGTNTDQHLYVDTKGSSACSNLVFQLGRSGFGGQSVASRDWSIKVTQYSCSYPNLAPSGCTQYYFGEDDGFVQTFNYNNGNGNHLANQDQTICIRREKSKCRICWNAEDGTDFQLSGTAISTVGFNLGTACCSYGEKGTVSKGYDCINIPGAEKTGVGKTATNSNFCGRSNGLVTKLVSNMAKTATNSKIICSRRTPFYIRFRSDNFEFFDEGTKANVGAKLSYVMDATNCV